MEKMLQKDRIFPVRNSRVATRTLDGEAVAISPDTQTLHKLSDVGTLIWELSDGTKSLVDITEKVVQTYDIEREVAENDVETFCQTLMEADLLTLNNSPLKSP